MWLREKASYKASDCRARHLWINGMLMHVMITYLMHKLNDASRKGIWMGASFSHIKISWWKNGYHKCWLSSANMESHITSKAVFSRSVSGTLLLSVHKNPAGPIRATESKISLVNRGEKESAKSHFKSLKYNKRLHGTGHTMLELLNQTCNMKCSLHFVHVDLIKYHWVCWPNTTKDTLWGWLVEG